MMSLDKFGRSAARSSDITSSHLLSPHRPGLVFTKEGNIDIGKLKLCNVQAPTEDDDAANKKYVDVNINTIKSFRKDMSGRLDKQKTFITDIKKSIKKLEAQVLNNEKLNTDVTTMKSNIASLSNTIKSIEKRLISLKEYATTTTTRSPNETL